MRRTAIFFSACALMLAGCSHQPGWGVHTVSWDRSEANKTTVPGIDAASVRFGTYGDGAAIAFWTDANNGECEAACPKEISLDFIALMNRDYVKAQFKQRRLAAQT